MLSQCIIQIPLTWTKRYSHSTTNCAQLLDQSNIQHKFVFDVLLLYLFNNFMCTLENLVFRKENSEQIKIFWKKKANLLHWNGYVNSKVHVCKSLNNMIESFSHRISFSHTHRKSFPSNLEALVNSTVLAGILIPIAKVSVANKA